MKLIPVKKYELKIVYKKTKNLKIFDEFLESDYNAVRVVDDSNRSTKTLSRSLHQSLRWFHYEDKIMIVKRGDNAYLIKKTSKLKEELKRNLWLFFFFILTRNSQGIL